jgi:hypothetical protein
MTQKAGEINESLDVRAAPLKCAVMTHSRLLAAASTAAFVLLAGCKSEPVTVGGAADPQAEALKNAPKVKLPPSIKESKIYRCKDNSVVYVNFMSDGITANVRDKEEEPPRTTLTAAAPGQPYQLTDPQGGKWDLSGSGDSVVYTSPDSGKQTCRAGSNGNKAR